MTNQSRLLGRSGRDGLFSFHLLYIQRIGLATMSAYSRLAGLSGYGGLIGLSGWSGLVDFDLQHVQQIGLSSPSNWSDLVGLGNWSSLRIHCLVRLRGRGGGASKAYM